MLSRKTQHKLTVVVIVTMVFLGGCVGRTGKVGTPISTRYQNQLASLKLGESTPDDLKKLFAEKKIPVSLKEAKIEGDKKVEIWQVARGGNMDAAGLILWGYVAYDKDQELLFRFENDKLVSYESVVIPDPTPAPVTPVSSPRNK
jgi:hypothetical protein